MCAYRLSELSSGKNKPFYFDYYSTVDSFKMNNVFGTKAIHLNGPFIKCPFCRNYFMVKYVSSLPTNSHALQMIKLKEKKIETPVVMKHSL